MALQGFSHVGVCCSDLDRSTRFYREVLGFRELFTVELGPEVAPTMEVDGRFRSRMLARDDLRLELLCWVDPVAQGDGQRRPMDRLGMTHLCFRVDDAEALDGMAEAAERTGGAVHPATLSVQPGMGVDGGPVKTMYLTDPDGVRIEVMSGAPDLGAL
jgi:glyoxylase I family protein